MGLPGGVTQVRVVEQLLLPLSPPVRERVVVVQQPVAAVHTQNLLLREMLVHLVVAAVAGAAAETWTQHSHGVEPLLVVAKVGVTGDPLVALGAEVSDALVLVPGVLRQLGLVSRDEAATLVVAHVGLLVGVLDPHMDVLLLVRGEGTVAVVTFVRLWGLVYTHPVAHQLRLWRDVSTAGPRTVELLGTLVIGRGLDKVTLVSLVEVLLGFLSGAETIAALGTVRAETPAGVDCRLLDALVVGLWHDLVFGLCNGRLICRSKGR